MVVLYHSFPLGTLLLHFFSFLYSVNFLVQDLGALNYPSGFWSSFALFYVVHLIVSCCSNYYYFLCFSFSELPDPAFRLSPPWNSKITGETFQVFCIFILITMFAGLNWVESSMTEGSECVCLRLGLSCC